MWVAHQLTTIGGISSITTSYWVENLRLSFSLSIKNMHEFEYFSTNWLEESDWNDFEKNQKLLVLLLECGRKVPVEEQHF